MPKGFFPTVERDSYMLQFVSFHHSQEGIDGAVDGTGIKSFAVIQWIADKGKERTVDKRRAIDEKEFVFHIKNLPISFLNFNKIVSMKFYSYCGKTIFHLTILTYFNKFQIVSKKDFDLN